MRTGLFRQQALTHQRAGFQGGLLMTPKPCYMFGTCVLVVWVLAAGLFLSHSSYARKTTVTGWLEPAQGIQKVYAEQRKGVVSDVYVSEAQWVAKGTPLVAINYGIQQTSGVSIEDSLISEIDKNATRIKAAIQRLTRQHQRTQQQLTQRLVDAKHDADALSLMSGLTLQQYHLATQQFDAQQALLTTGNISKSELNQSKIQAISARQQWQHAIRNSQQKHAEIRELTYELQALPETLANDTALLENQLSELSREALTISRQQKHILYAARDGVVSGLQAFAGQSVAHGLPLLSILPVNTAIEAKLLVPVSAAGFIHAGQILDIRYDAFPYQKFGLQEGSITSISDGLLLPGEWKDAPVTFSEPAYLVKARLTRHTIDAYGKAVPLKSGMTFSADVALSQRSLLEWLFEPLLSISGRI